MQKFRHFWRKKKFTRKSHLHCRSVLQQAIQFFFCHLDQTCHIMGELYQLQASSPVTSRVHQTHSAVTGVTGYGPYWQPWFFSISKWVLRQNLSYENEFDMHENQDSAGWAHFGSIFMNSLCSHEDSFWHRQKATWKWPIKSIWKLHVWLAVK